MTTLRVIGIDPGPQPGLVLLRFGISTPWWPCSVQAIQCSSSAAPDCLNLLLCADAEDTRTVVGIERFVRSSRSARLRSAGAASKTERMVTDLYAQVMEWFGPSRLPDGDRVYLNNAARVKRWAIHERLDAAGLLEATNGMTHARDAARHAMFVSCEAPGGAPDPLSRRPSTRSRKARA